VWFIKKSNDGDGFQTWHKDLVNNGQIDVTVVLNTGSYEESVDTDDNSVDSTSALGLSKSPPYFFLDGSEVAYYSVDELLHVHSTMNAGRYACFYLMVFVLSRLHFNWTIARGYFSMTIMVVSYVRIYSMRTY
jgi:hypothetical protein